MDYGKDTTLRRPAAYGVPEFVIASVDLDCLGKHDDALLLESVKFQFRLDPNCGISIIKASGLEGAVDAT